MNVSRLKHGCVLGLSLASLCGCGSPQPPISNALPLSSAALPAISGQELYAANCCGVLNTGGVTIYAAGQHKIVRQIVHGLFDPIHLALDGAGTLYVLDQSEAGPEGVAISEYDRGSEKLSRRLEGFYWITDFVLDGSNELYAADCNRCVDSGDQGAKQAQDKIFVYEPKKTKPSRAIVNGVNQPLVLSLDAAGNLYVANAGNGLKKATVTVYAPGSGKLKRTIRTPGTYPDAMTVDRAGDVYVNEGGAFAMEVREFARGSGRVLRTIRDGIDTPLVLLTDAKGTLYVANWPGSPSRAGWISVYAPGATKPKYEISKGISGPIALALDARGDLYVANNRDRAYVTVYAPGSEKPLLLIPSGEYGPFLSLAIAAP